MHGHFLPEMDDGSRSVEMSVAMLAKAGQQGIGRMFATPHYYPVEPVSAFLERREKAAQKLQEAVDKIQQDLPAFCLGAEVAYRPGIGYEKDLEKLCLGNSRYLLLEMPFDQWNGTVVRDVRNMTSALGIIPIIAHVERYPVQKNRQIMAELMEQDILLQMNTRHLLRWTTRGKGRQLLKSGAVGLLGSDCHNMAERSPDLGDAVAYLRKCGMHQTLDQIAWLSNHIFEEAVKR